jgi:hypothetical protein
MGGPFEEMAPKRMTAPALTQTFSAQKKF